MSRPYRFTQEQQALLDAHFGEREVWLPMELDDLVAALVEAQAAEVLSKKLPDHPDTSKRAMYDSSQAFATKATPTDRRRSRWPHPPSPSS